MGVSKFFSEGVITTGGVHLGGINRPFPLRLVIATLVK